MLLLMLLCVDARKIVKKIVKHKKIQHVRRAPKQYVPPPAELFQIENPSRFKVSYLIPVFNQARFIEGCIQNILQQDHQNFEIVIVDDKSTDESVEIVKRLQLQHPEIVLYQQPHNKGTLLARLKLMELFSGDYAIFVDADDYFTQTNVVGQCLAKSVLQEADICAISFAHFHLSDGHIGFINHKQLKNNIYNTMSSVSSYNKAKFKIPYFHHIWCYLYTRQILKQTLKETQEVVKNTHMVYKEDNYLVRVIATLGKKIVVQEQVGFYHVQHDGQVTKALQHNPKYKTDKETLRRLIQQTPILNGKKEL